MKLSLIAYEILFANLQTIMAKDVVGGGQVEIEVRRGEVERIVRALGVPVLQVRACHSRSALARIGLGYRGSRMTRSVAFGSSACVIEAERHGLIRKLVARLAVVAYRRRHSMSASRLSLMNRRR